MACATGARGHDRAVNTRVFAFLLLSTSLALADEQARLGIFNLKVVGLDPALAASGIDALATTLGGLNVGEVVTAAELQALIDAEKRKDALGCDDVSCLVEIGNAAGIERLVAGSLTHAGEKLVVSLQLINVKQGKVGNRVTLEWKGAVSEFANVLGAAAELLVLPPTSRVPGNLTLVHAPDGVEWRVGQQRADKPSVELDVGVYSLHVDALGFESREIQAIVRAGKTTAVEAALSPSASGSVIGLASHLGLIKPLNDAYQSNRPGLAIDVLYWHELSWLVLEPRFGVRWDVVDDGKASYLELVGDMGASWLMLRRSITPFVGVGIGPRWLRRMHAETIVIGSVISTTQNRTVEAEGFGVGGYGKAGVLFFRDSGVRATLSVEYDAAYLGADAKLQALTFLLGFVL